MKGEVEAVRVAVALSLMVEEDILLAGGSSWEAVMVRLKQVKVSIG